jgi:hypothetical protein
VRVLHKFRKLAQVARRLDPDRGQLDNMRAEGAQLVA